MEKIIGVSINPKEVLGWMKTCVLPLPQVCGLSLFDRAVNYKGVVNVDEEGQLLLAADLFQVHALELQSHFLVSLELKTKFIYLKNLKYHLSCKRTKRQQNILFFACLRFLNTKYIYKKNLKNHLSSKRTRQPTKHIILLISSFSKYEIYLSEESYIPSFK